MYTWYKTNKDSQLELAVIIYWAGTTKSPCPLLTVTVKLKQLSVQAQLSKCSKATAYVQKHERKIPSKL